MAPANLRDGLQVSWRRRDRSQCGAAHGFKDEARGFAVRRLDRALQFGGILLSAVVATIGAIASPTKRAAIAVWNADVLKLTHHRQVDLAPFLIAGNRKRAQSRAVIALLAAQNPMAILLADLHLVLARQLQRGLDRLRPAAGEVNSAAAKMLAGKIEQFLRKFLGHWSGELAGMDKLQLPSLPRHGIGNFAHAVANEVHSRRSREIEVAIAVAIPHVDALASHRRGIGLAKRPAKHRRAKLLLSQSRFGHTRIMLVETGACQSCAGIGFPCVPLWTLWLRIKSVNHRVPFDSAQGRLRGTQGKAIAASDSGPPITLPTTSRCVNLRRMRLLRFFRPSHQHTAFSATLLLMTTITLSRVIGYIREAYIAYAFGAGLQTDAYVAAFTLPDWLNYIVAGGTASITFISIYTRFVAEKREQDAQKTFSIIITVMTTVLVAGTVLAEIFTPQFAGWMFHGFTPYQMRLCVHLTRILLPAQIFFYVGGVVSAVLLSHRLFLFPAFGPLIYNVFIIAGGVMAGHRMGIRSEE